MAENVNPFHMLYMRLRSQNSDVLCNILSRLFTEGEVSTILTQDLRLRVLEEAELSIDPVPKASIGKRMPRTPYYTVRDPQPQPPPQETTMIERRDLSSVEEDPKPVEQEDDPKPVREVIPVDDLDRIEKLLDVSVNTVDMPNLAHIKQACMEELAQIDAGLATSQAAANEAYTRELAVWENKQQQKAEAKKKAEESDDAS